MSNGEQQERLALARRLRLYGVPLEIPEDDHPFSHSPQTGVFIRQIKGSATQFNPWEVGYCVFLRIVNNLPSAFWITGFRLELPWQERPYLLGDPGELDPPLTYYNFQTTGTAFKRDEVLNSVYMRKFSRGSPLEGWLLWSGEVPIPAEYGSGSHVAAFVVVVDQFGRAYREPLSLRVERKRFRPELRKRSRRNITGKPPDEISLDQVPESDTGALCEAEESGNTEPCSSTVRQRPIVAG